MKSSVRTQLLTYVLCGLFPLFVFPQTASWSANPESDMHHYNIAYWVGSDSSQAPFVDNTPMSNYPSYELFEVVHDTSASYSYPLPVSPDSNGVYPYGGIYIQVAVSAVDTDGLESNIAASNIYFNNVPPGKPADLILIFNEQESSFYFRVVPKSHVVNR